MATSWDYYTPAEQVLLQHPDTMDSICAHVGAGGALDDLCKAWHESAAKSGGVVRFGHVWRWVCEDRDRFKRWLESNNLQAQADVSRADAELRAIAFADIRGLLDEQGRVLPVSQWPRDAARLVAGLDVAEMFERGEAGVQELVGIMKKVKTADRLKALELLLKRNGALVDKREVTGKLTLEELVAGAAGEEGK